MKLNENSKNELRKMIEEKLMYVSDGVKIHLDKSLLEELLFYNLSYYDFELDKVANITLPIWNGDFLSKIDLSEVSFDNVEFWITEEIIGNSIIDIDDCRKHIGDKNFDKQFNYYKECFFEEKETLRNGIKMKKLQRKPVVYRNTNAKIKSLSNSFHSCDFEGTDLSHLNLDNIGAWSTNFSKTNIKTEKSSLNIDGIGHENNFSDLNLKGVNVLLSELTCWSEVPCDNFANSGINLINDEKEDKSTETFIELMIKKGYLNNCYVDGKFIEPVVKKDKETILNEYEIFKNEIFANVSHNIEEQISTIKK